MVDFMSSVSSTLGSVKSGIRINTEVLNYFSSTPLRTSARRYFGLAANRNCWFVSYDCQLVCWFVNYDLHGRGVHASLRG